MLAIWFYNNGVTCHCNCWPSTHRERSSGWRSGVALKVQEQTTRMKTEHKIWCNGSGHLQPLLDWGAESTVSPAFISNCRLQNFLWSIFPKTLHWHSPALLVFTPGHSLPGKSWEQSASTKAVFIPDPVFQSPCFHDSHHNPFWGLALGFVTRSLF